MKAVIFDLDDTLYAESSYMRSGFAAVAAHLADKLGVDSDRLRRRMVGLEREHGRGKVFDTVLSEHGAHSQIRVRSLVLLYRTHRPDIALFPGARELLLRLRAAGLRVGLITDGQATMQRNKIAGLGIADLFDAVVCCDELGADCWKPSRVPFEVALELLGVAPAHATFVGNDPARDFEAPRALGMRTVQLRHPEAVARDVSPYADVVTESLNDIPDLLSLHVNPI